MKIAIFYDFANFDRPKKGRIFLHGWLELDEILPTIATKIKNSENFWSKNLPQSRKILMRFPIVKTLFDHNSAKSARTENSFGGYSRLIS